MKMANGVPEDSYKSPVKKQKAKFVSPEEKKEKRDINTANFSSHK